MLWSFVTIFKSQFVKSKNSEFLMTYMQDVGLITT